MKIISIDRIAVSGHGVGNDTEGNTWHVLGTFPGDVVKIKPYHSSEGINYAEIFSIEKPSLHRNYTPIQAPFFNPQAPWLYLGDQQEKEYKTCILKNLFPNIIENKELFNPKQTTQYRNKSAFAFVEHNRKLLFANFQRGISGNKKSSYIEHILNHPMIEKVSKLFLDFFNQHHIPKDELKYLTLRYSYSTKTCVAHILVTQGSRKKLTLRKKDLEDWVHRYPEIAGILVSYSLPDIRSAKVEKDLFEIGNIIIKENVLGKEYIYHPSQFFQIYPEAFAEILKDIEKNLSAISDIQSYELLDLFSGVGIIGIHLAHLVHRVIAVEHSPLSKKFAIKNAELNNLNNFEFYESDVEQALNYVQSKQILIVDPPRSGLGIQIRKRIEKIKPVYIIYISCNPKTQARDIQNLYHDYEIYFARGYNLFPKTHHIEHCIILKRKNL